MIAKYKAIRIATLGLDLSGFLFTGIPAHARQSDQQTHPTTPPTTRAIRAKQQQQQITRKSLRPLVT
jgi:hypothetical protein